MKKLVGVYQLGFRNVELYADTKEDGGHVSLSPGKITEVVIGIDQHWPDVFGTLLHEAYECVLVDMSTRYKQQPSYSLDASDFIFLITHNQLSEAHDRVANFLVDCEKDFSKMYELLNRKAKRKKKQ
jgi:hypothetical protein